MTLFELFYHNTTDHKQKMANPFAVSHFSMLRRLMFYFFWQTFQKYMSSKYSIFVDELMIRIILVVDILREYAHSKNLGDSAIWFIGVHIANILT